ncbi:glutamyl aminopeptidase-like [Ixodes scapularis]
MSQPTPGPTFGTLAAFDANVESWTNYAERLEAFFEANAIVDSNRKRSILITSVGPETYARLRSLLAPKKPMDEAYDEILKVLAQHLNPEPSEIYQTYRFQTRVQGPNEKVADYVAELRKIADDCNFGAALERNLRDRFVIGLREKTVKKVLLAKPKTLDLNEALGIARAAEGNHLHRDVSSGSRKSAASMAMLAVTVVAAVLLWSLLLGHTEANDEKLQAQRIESSHRRLPKNVRPENYKLNITMDPDFNSSGYGGSVDITFGVLEDTEEIVLHASESIDILAYSLGKCGSQVRKLRRSENYLHLPLDKPIRKGSPSCVLSLNFRGSFGDDSRGFYKIEISEENIQWVTFFEPDGAHLAFPCFDEPALKATFDLTLVRPAGLTTVSNMPILRSRKRGPTQKIAEHKSPTEQDSHKDNIRALSLPKKTKPDIPVSRAQRIESSHRRLPKNVRPENYKLNITMDPDFNSSGYGGSVDITFGVIEDTEEIVLHASESIDILAYSLGKCGSHLRKLRRSENYLHLPLDKPIRKGSPPCVLSLNFRGSFGDDSRGFYKIEISEENIQWVTFFEPDGAHLAFPCFDEPALKATFDLTLVRPAGLTTVSNMPILRSRKRSSSLIEDTFQQTPVMSTYTLAWCLFGAHVKKADGKITVYGIGLEDKIVSKALYLTKIYLGYFERYFGINYTMPKLDIVTTWYFPFAGMENWGAILARNGDLMKDVYEGGTMLAHEVIHQWLGNLATNFWWSAIWIQEAPTHYLSSLVSSKQLGTQEPYQEKDTLDQELDIREMVENVRPTVIPEKNNFSAWDMLNFAEDVRARNIMRMFHRLMGDEFHLAIKLLVQRAQFSTLNEEDFYKALNDWLGNLATNFWWSAIWIQEAPTYYLSALVSSRKLGTQETYLQKVALDRKLNSEEMVENVRPTVIPEKNNFSAWDMLNFAEDVRVSRHGSRN